jgi:hypothetical protein
MQVLSFSSGMVVVNETILRLVVGFADQNKEEKIYRELN